MLQNSVGWEALGRIKGDLGDLALEKSLQAPLHFPRSSTARIVSTEVESDGCLINSSNTSLAVRYRGT